MATERRKSWVEMTDRNSKWFTWADIVELTGGRQEVTLRVVRADQGKIEQSKKRVVALHLEDASGVKVDKPLGLNPTNAKTITAIYGTDKPDDWADKHVLLTLFVGRANDPSSPIKGAQCNCVRIKPVIPTAGALHRKSYDHAAWLEIAAAASTSDEVQAARELATALKPPKEHHAEIKAAIDAAIARVNAAMSAAHVEAIEDAS